MNPEIQEGLEHIENIEKELGEIRARTGNSKRAFFNGLLQGAGAVIGSVLAIALVGWVLSFFGIIPGFSEIAQYLHSILDHVGTRA